MSDEIERDTLLRRIAGELHDMAELTAHVEGVLATAGRGTGTSGSTARGILQELDSLRQTQTSLAKCLERIAHGTPPSGRLNRSDLLDGSVLLSVAERLLSGRSVSESRAATRDHEIW